MDNRIKDTKSKNNKLSIKKNEKLNKLKEEIENN